MKLTGKCKDDFETWFNNKRNEVIKDGNFEYDLYYIFTYMMPEVCKNALIIEWFDSVGIVIIIDNNGGCFHFIIKETHNNSFGGLRKHWQDDESKKRLDAINSAIEKANELYNNPIAY
jgi:hypothetical protein